MRVLRECAGSAQADETAAGRESRGRTAQRRAAAEAASVAEAKVYIEASE